jgi:ketosteroid isomerase-like protein
MTPVEDASLATVRAMYDALFKGDMAAVMAMMHDDAELEVLGPPSNMFVGRHRGRDELARFFGVISEHVFREPDDPVPAVHEYVVQGEKIVAIGVDRVTNRARDGSYESWWVHVLELRDGKIARVREFFDTAAALDVFRKVLDD